MAYRIRFNDPSGGYTAWELKHVEDITIEISKNVTVFGLPTKSTNATQVFDMAGAVRTFTLQFVRFDWEEEVSNWNFLFTKNNRVGNKIYKGLDWFTAQLQVTHPYLLQIAWVGDEDDPEQLPTGTWNVSVTGISYTLSKDNPGMGSFSIDFTERRG